MRIEEMAKFLVDFPIELFPYTREERCSSDGKRL
jgi:hypothetical protein